MQATSHSVSSDPLLDATLGMGSADQEAERAENDDANAKDNVVNTIDSLKAEVDKLRAENDKLRAENDDLRGANGDGDEDDTAGDANGDGAEDDADGEEDADGGEDDADGEEDADGAEAAETEDGAEDVKSVENKKQTKSSSRRRARPANVRHNHTGGILVAIKPSGYTKQIDKSKFQSGKQMRGYCIHLVGGEQINCSLTKNRRERVRLLHNNSCKGDAIRCEHHVSNWKAIGKRTFGV
jgi:hypothetical protein